MWEKAIVENELGRPTVAMAVLERLYHTWHETCLTC